MTKSWNGVVRMVAVVTAGAAIGVLAVDRPARAQDALGAGNALDGNLSTQGRSNAPRAREDYRMRNLVVTGNVTGGRGFRDAVGYTAERDFRGHAGSDDTFKFRADAAFSNPQVFILGQRFDQIRFGADMATLEFRRDTTPTGMLPMSGVSEVWSTREVTSDWTATQLRLDQYTMEQTTSRLSESAMSSPQTVGSAVGPKGNTFLFNATPARGITYDPMDELQSVEGLTLMDRVRLKQDAGDEAKPEGVGRAFQPRFSGSQTEAMRTTTEVEATPLSVPMSSDYQNVLDEVAKRYAEERKRVQESGRPPKDVTKPGEEKDEETEGPGAGVVDEVPGVEKPGVAEITDLEKQYEQWRLRLRPEHSTNAPGAKRPGSERPGETAQPTDAEPNEPAENAGDEMLPLVLGHGQTVDSLAAESSDRFNEVMRIAQTKLGEGKYFEAERRFAHALRFSPDNPMGLAGLGHAQLGAGLDQAASTTLRRLLSLRPEMIDVRYDAATLPKSEDLTKAVERVRRAIADGTETSANGFLLGYLGHVLNDRAIMEEGLNAMEKARPNDVMVGVLKGVWLK